MPDLPDIPGKDLVEGSTRRARAIAGAAAGGAFAVGGFILRKVLSRGGDDDRPEPGPAVAAPAKPKPAPKPKVAKPEPAESEAAKPAKVKAEKPKPVKPKPKPIKPKPKAEEPKPGTEPDDQRGGKDPHHALNNPVADPDETEYPDPFDKREDPRDPVDPDDAPFGAQPHPPTGAESTSEPPPIQDPEVGDRARPPRRDKLDG